MAMSGVQDFDVIEREVAKGMQFDMNFDGRLDWVEFSNWVSAP